MTSHELASKLLEGPDVPIELFVQGNIGEGGCWDAFFGTLHDIENKDGIVRLFADDANSDDDH